MNSLVMAPEGAEEIVILWVKIQYGSVISVLSTSFLNILDKVILSIC
jgi:hypothetical protein